MLVPLNELTIDPSNVRKHSKRNLEAIRESLERFGQVKPIVVNRDKKVIAGNGTVEAARKLGWDSVEVVFFDGEAHEQTAYAIADNRTASLADWDNEGLLAQLNDLDSDLAMAAGFNQSELDELMKAFGTPDEVTDAVGDPFGDGKVRVSFRLTEDEADVFKKLLQRFRQGDDSDDDAAARLIWWVQGNLSGS